jgi:hypothetical protein
VGAFAGTWADVLRAQLYLDGQIDTDPEGDRSAIIIRPNGTVHAMDDDGCRMDVTGKRYAIGSGAHFALGALACGRGAVEAVRVAIELDPYSRGEIEHVAAATVTYVSEYIPKSFFSASVAVKTCSSVPPERLKLRLL